MCYTSWNHEKNLGTGGNKNKKFGNEIVVLKKLSFLEQLFFPIRADLADTVVLHQYTKNRKLFHDSPMSSGIQKVWRCQKMFFFSNFILEDIDKPL